jgi:hypothetical protein
MEFQASELSGTFVFGGASRDCLLVLADRTGTVSSVVNPASNESLGSSSDVFIAAMAGTSSGGVVPVDIRSAQALMAKDHRMDSVQVSWDSRRLFDDAVSHSFTAYWGGCWEYPSAYSSTSASSSASASASASASVFAKSSACANGASACLVLHRRLRGWTSLLP